MQVRADEGALRKRVTLAVNGVITANFPGRRRLPVAPNTVT